MLVYQSVYTVVVAELYTMSIVIQLPRSFILKSNNITRVFLSLFRHHFVLNSISESHQKVLKDFSGASFGHLL